MTHRQFVGWTRWLDTRWNVPSRLDHYVMQLTAVLKACHGQASSLSEQKIVFEDGPREEEEEITGDGSPESRIRMSAAIEASGGLVRILQEDGSHRMYDVIKGEYVNP